MQLLFVADIHIKLGQKGVPIPWALNRYELFREQLYKQCENADVLVLGGDIFDKHPNTEELSVYFSLVSGIPIPCYIIPGNHESVKKNTTFLTHLKNVTTLINPRVKIIDDYETLEFGGVPVDFLPYNKLKEYHPADIDFHSKILVTHVRGEIPPHVKPEVDLSMFDRWDVVLAGDLHSYENCQRNILYPGSPMTTSFHRSKVKTGAILLDLETLQHQWLVYDLPQMIRKTLRPGETPVATDYDLTLYEVEGDLSELANVEASDLIDKRVTRRNTDVALILDPKMTIRQELQEYLLFILALEDSEVIEILKEYDDSNR